MHTRQYIFGLTLFALLFTCQASFAQTANWTDAKLINVPAPEYPKEAKATGLTGKVSVMVELDANGAVTNARDATGPDWICPQVERPDVVALRNAAKAAALKAKFTPAMQDGKPTASTMVVNFQFTIINRVNDAGCFK